ncbi:hypothetical protein FY048_05185 [Acinetobacter sp. 1124_18A]
MVAERKRVDRLVRRQHTRRCPSPVLPLREGTRSLHIRLFLRRNNPDAVVCSLSKLPGNVGQPANGNLQYLRCQCEIG